MDDFQNSKENAVQVAKCLEGIELEDLLDSSVVHIQPADSVKESLNKDFEGLAVRASDLTSALETRGDNPTDVEQKVKFEYSEELKEVGKLNLDLNKILEAKKINSDKNKLSSAQQILSSTFREPSSTSKVSPIKINKPDPIKFSGQPRDFATFKRSFEAIIVPNRSIADIGLYLKQAIPSKDLHLIDNVDIENYSEMMNILAKEFGTTRKIVDSVITEMEKFKVVTTDKMFIDFVEKLEKIHRDLKTMKMLEEVANAPVIGKLESKLPTVIDQRWTEAVIKEEYDNESSKDKFEHLMKFLAQHKEMVKYRMSDARTSGGQKTQTQTCFVTSLSAKVQFK